jgi:hypothetical protein
MSHRIEPQPHRAEGDANKQPCTAFKRYPCYPCECLNPLCHIMLEGEGRDDRVYCSDRCRTVTSILRRAGELLKDLTDEKALAIIREKREPFK